MTEEEQLNLSGKTWVPLPRISFKVPFGYIVDPEDDKTILPVIFELEALERAKEYRRKKYSYRKIAVWLTQVTGRYISGEGLRKRLEVDRNRTRKVVTLTNFARKYKEAIEAAKETDARIGNDTSVYDSALKELLHLSTHKL